MIIHWYFLMHNVRLNKHLFMHTMCFFFALTQHMFNVIIDNITSPKALMPNFWLVSRLSVCHNFQNGREATLPYHTHYHCRLLITGQPQLCRLPGPDG